MSSQEWYKDEFLISTSPNLLQPDAVNEAFASDAMYWCKAMAKEDMKKLLDNSLCFGLYALPQTSAELAGQQGPSQIGLARLITDKVTFAYLTDVYVLDKYQKKGLGKWLIDCVGETVDSWPELRRMMLIASQEPVIEFYRQNLGMEPFEQGKGGLKLLGKRGKSSPMKH